ncbi:MAG: ATP-binding protein [Candidatus Zixiibacteriota bacterium]
MFVYYNRRSHELDVRPSWVIGTRTVAFIATVASAWPLLSSNGDLKISLIVYAAATVASLSLQPIERRWALTLLGPFARLVQLTCEVIVISQVVLYTGGMRSPSIFLYLMTIVSGAVSHRLVGTLLVASASSLAYITVVVLEAGQGLPMGGFAGWGQALSQLPDEDFFTVFVRLCIFFLCAFSGGYLAERLSRKDAVLAHTTEQLKVAKLETGDILKHLQSGILTLDLAGHIVYFNRAAAEILGVPDKRVIGRPVREALGAQYPELVERLESVLISQKMDSRTELAIRRADGKNIPLGISTSVLGGAGGRSRGLVSIFQDLTEPKQLEEKLRAQDRMAAIGELSAAIAHEIRNPLTAISGSVEVLRNELNVQDSNRKLLDLIIKESARLNKILTDFLTYARIRPTVTGRVGVAPVLDEVFEITRRRFDGKQGLVLRTRQEDPSLSVRADTDHLKQMLINLVFNAVEAIPHDHGEVTVTVAFSDDGPVEAQDNATASPDGWVTVAVSDNGEGIPESVRPRLFQPFVSSKAAGTGLGLAIVSRLAQHDGGTVKVTSVPNQGSTFTLILPRVRAPRIRPARAASNADSTGPISVVARESETPANPLPHS